MKIFFTFLLVATLTFSTFSQDECSELFFSEYVEGTGNNKAIEIYNPTDRIINLADYYVARYSNGSLSYTGGGLTNLQGFIQPHSTFVLVNGQTSDQDLGGGSISPKADPELQAMADQLDHSYPAPMYMNGNDAIGLLKDPNSDGNLADAVPVDLFGAIGGGMTSGDEGWAAFTDEWVYRNIYNDQGAVTGVDSAYIRKYIVPENYYWIPWTSNHTLKRKPSVTAGVTTNPSVFNVTLEWDTIPGGADQWDNLGMHTSQCAGQTGMTFLNNKAEASIFPNPVRDGKFTINSSVPLRSYSLLNALGQVVISNRNNYNDLKTEVEIPDVQRGVYFIQMEFENNQVLSKKLLIY